MHAIQQTPALINGQPIAAPESFEVLNPSTGESLALVASCGVAEVDAAVVAARLTFEREWRQSTV
ncbi:MAG: aldehyde dehydrogenase family protein, partial [Candidatus Dormibacteraceae bacterium]